MPKGLSLLDEVKSGLSSRRGFSLWYETLDSGLRTELEAIKASWLAGHLTATKTTLAKRLSTVLKGRGIDIGHQGVLRWLERT